uniref:Uncharacterized protein n=1 Tax=Cannabis sativa TaxID=3483 RepID=A0A803P6H4_CANSA
MWYLDTGCSNHMCRDKKAFSEMDESFRTTVKFGNNSKIFVMEKGREAAHSNIHGPKNGVCERKNCAIINMVRSLLLRSGLPKDFWPEAVNWNIHILNKSPTFAVKNMTLEEAWSGRRPAVDHFRIIGSVAYAHIPDEKGKKLDDKEKKCIFLGVSDQSIAYKLYNPNTKKIIISRNVIFDEERIWAWNENIVQQQILANFDGDEEKRQQRQPVEIVPQPTTTITQSSHANEAPTEQRPQRERKKPAWMMDYEVSNFDDSEEDPLTHFCLFSYCDPVAYEKAAKESK